MFILEEYAEAKRKNVKIWAELKGFGQTCDAYHSTSPHPKGTYLTGAIRKALDDSGIRPNKIDCILAYGNGTKINDIYETKVIKEVFGKYAYKLPVSSIKSMIGHSIGSSGAAQVAAGIVALSNDFIPPTIGLENPDPACDLDYVAHYSRKAKLQNVLCDTLSFGGKNAAVVISRGEL
jgi:3-oxoacyl-[acyl-carrier-protein] synthase II